MNEVYITEEELEYYTNVPNTLNEGMVGILSREEFARETQDCISLEQFSNNIDEAIRRLIPNP